MTEEELCIICECRPRAVRLQCGHLFACVECVVGLRDCSICRAPIIAGYNILGQTSLSDSSRDGYNSSGNETFVNVEECHTAGCTLESMHWFTCSSLSCAVGGRDHGPFRFTRCQACSEMSTCPHCLTLAVRDTTSEPGSSPASCDEEGCFGDSAAITARDPVRTTSRLMKALKAKCFLANMILEVTEEVVQAGVDATWLALDTCVSRMGGDCSRRSLCIAPTVPLVNQYAAAAAEFSSLTPCVVRWSGAVDMWHASDWDDVLRRHNIIFTTPQLMLDALDDRRLHLNTFCTLVIIACGHCAFNEHPSARIMSDHYTTVPAGQIRVVGIAKYLVKPKMKDNAERREVMRKIGNVMDSQVVDVNEL